MNYNFAMLQKQMNHNQNVQGTVTAQKSKHFIFLFSSSGPFGLLCITVALYSNWYNKEFHKPYSSGTWILSRM